MKIYVTRQNSDLCEGRGPIVNVGYFTNREVAVYANSKIPGVFGTKNDCSVQEIEVCTAQRIEDLVDFEKDQKRQKALSKLTIEERNLLGLA